MMTSSPLTDTIKVVLLGNSEVGKTSLAKRFVHGIFNHYSESTIGSSFFTKTIDVLDDTDDRDRDDNGIVSKNENEAKDGSSDSNNSEHAKGQHITINCWDTAGQEKYRSLSAMYYRGAQAAIVLYDISNPVSFEAAQGWVNELQEERGLDNLFIAICGNKCDLDGACRQVEKRKAEVYAKSIGAIHVETSARTDINVDFIFRQVALNAVDKLRSCEDQHDEHSGTSKDTDAIDLRASLLESNTPCMC